MPDEQILDTITIFNGLGKDERAYLVSTMTRKVIPALEILYRAGDAGRDMFIILEGQVEISVADQSGLEIRLAVHGAGEFVGEISFLDQGPRTTTARTLRPSDVLVLSHANFVDAIRRFPAIAMAVIDVLSRRQRATVERIRGIPNLNEVIDQKRTHWQRLANHIAALAASQSFLLAHALIFGAWILTNILLPKSRAPDPFPFLFLCFWTSTEAIFLSLFILISQSEQAQKDRLRNDVEYQIALKTHFELMQLQRKIEEQAPPASRRDD